MSVEEHRTLRGATFQELEDILAAHYKEGWRKNGEWYRYDGRVWQPIIRKRTV